MLKTLMTTAALASLFLAGAAAAQTPIRNAAGDYTTGPITTDQAWANGVTYWGEYRQVHSPEYFDTIPYDPQKDPGAGGLRFPEFRVILQKEFDQADRNDNGRIDNETERCLFHRTPEGIAAGGDAFWRAVEQAAFGLIIDPAIVVSVGLIEFFLKDHPKFWKA